MNEYKALGTLVIIVALLGGVALTVSYAQPDHPFDDPGIDSQEWGNLGALFSWYIVGIIGGVVVGPLYNGDSFEAGVGLMAYWAIAGIALYIITIIGIDMMGS